jgi:PAS domain S-box-containing protein
MGSHVGLDTIMLVTLTAIALLLLITVVLLASRLRALQGKAKSELLEKEAKIQALVETQKLLKQNDQRFQQMSSYVREIFWITDARGGTPVYISPAFEQIYGRTVQSIFDDPKQFFGAAHPDDRERLANVIRLQRTVSHSCEIEFRICRPDGEIRWIWARLFPMLGEKGELTGLCGISSDITEKKQAEIRVSEFYSMVSHELRTPLTSIRGSLKLIEGGRTGDVSAKTMQLIKIGVTESERLMRLINDILDIKRAEGGQFHLKGERIDPERLANRALESVASVAEEAGIVLKCSVTTKRECSGDFERLLQVLTNFLSNAIKFSNKGCEVSLIVEDRENKAIRFSVRDDGPGIPEDKMHKLFKLFQQLDSSDARMKGGAGLGLALSKAIVEVHHGRIGVDSTEGKGSTFWFELASENEVGAEKPA